MANTVLYSHSFSLQLVTALWRLGATHYTQRIHAHSDPNFKSILDLLKLADLPNEECRHLLQILLCLLNSYRDLELADQNIEPTSLLLIEEGLGKFGWDKTNYSYGYKNNQRLSPEISSSSALNKSSSTSSDHGKKSNCATSPADNLPSHTKKQDSLSTQEIIPLLSQSAPIEHQEIKQEKILNSFAHALVNFQNKKQTVMRAIGGFFSFFYAVLSSCMNLFAFLTVFSLPPVWVWVCGSLIFTSGFGINFLGTYRVIPEMFSKTLTYIRNGIFWKSVFSYYSPTEKKYLPLSTVKRVALVTGFFASLGAAFGTSFLATSSLSAVLIALHIMSAAFPPAFAIVCIASFTLFMTPLLTYAFSALIKQENILRRTWDTTKNFFKNIFGCSTERNQGKSRARVIFEGICTLALLGFSLFGLWATMSTFNVSMNTMLTGTFKVNETIASGISKIIGVAMNFVAEIPFVIETVGRTIHSVCAKVASWFCRSSITPEEKVEPIREEKESEEPRSFGQKIKSFFSSAWTWFSKIGSAIGEGLIAIDGKSAQSYPAALGQGISAAASSNLDDDISDEKTRVQHLLIEKTRERMTTQPQRTHIQQSGRSSPLSIRDQKSPGLNSNSTSSSSTSSISCMQTHSIFAAYSNHENKPRRRNDFEPKNEENDRPSQSLKTNQIASVSPARSADHHIG